MELRKVFTVKKYSILTALFCSILWGSAFPVLKISYTELNISPENIYAKVLFAGMRFFIASVLLIFMTSFYIQESKKINKNILLQLFLLGILQTTLQYFFFYNGLSNTTGIKGAVLTASGSFFVVVLAHIVYHDDKMDLKKIIGLISGFGGVILINWERQGLDFSFSLFGEGFLLFSALVSSFGTILAKNLSRKVHPFTVTGLQMFIGSVILLLIGLIGTEGKLLAFTPKAWLLLIYASFLSATAFALWYSLLKYNKAGEITIYKFMIPVSGSLLSSIFLPDEKLTNFILISLILVSLGIVSINYEKKREKSVQ
ncbi:DMT family transporter [Thermohalobacter berrensis]|uniref:Multidrug transporter n=1 Tax=Thermohalobacter berrensis TaxID=99594 RepID=A0A419T9K9_9FIRM|nr:DMT family transporter [Thermohalobacter berrensis]RKD34153.1 multidrug transporter [Thermohalobacter berrensis]